MCSLQNHILMELLLHEHLHTENKTASKKYELKTLQLLTILTNHNLINNYQNHWIERIVRDILPFVITHLEF